MEATPSTETTPVVAAAVTKAEVNPSERQMHDVENLIQELKRLLVNHETTLAEEGISHEVELLERWMESYRRGLAAAGKLSGTGMNWLEDLRAHLKLAVEERHRLESEGGNPSSKEQSEKTEELLKALQRIEAVMPGVEHLFAAPAPAEKQPEPA